MLGFIKNLFKKNKAELLQDELGFNYIESGYDILTIKRYFAKKITEELGGIENLLEYVISSVLNSGYEIVEEKENGAIFTKDDNTIIMTYSDNTATISIRKGEYNHAVFTEVLKSVDDLNEKILEKHYKKFR